VPLAGAHVEGSRRSAGGERKPFPVLHGDFNESQGQFSPDGLRFLINAPLDAVSPSMTIVQNWTAGFKE
jgi:hypothetical protein